MNDSLLDKSSRSEPAHEKFSLARKKEGHVDQIIESASEWFSAILVKETRQALKSRQFFWTFFLLLAAVGVWTLIGMTISDSAYDSWRAGPSLLTGYWMILGFPLLVVIPFGSYRSLAQEYDDGTIQLISISTMRSWQIVAGKLGSSLLQMMVYLAVLAPCIAFTYLLRGISLPQIILGMSLCIFASICLANVGLFLAGATHSRVFGVSVTILLVIILGSAYIAWFNLSWALAFSVGEFEILTRREGQMGMYGILAVMISTAMMLFAGASVQVSFDADNRSTILRIMMLVQQTLFLGWTVAFTVYFLEYHFAWGFALVYGHYWMIMGWALVGESRDMSQRVKRSLPKSLVARALFSWFLPGPGRGLIFAICNVLACGVFTLLLLAFGGELLPLPQYDNAIFAQDRSNITMRELELVFYCLIATSIYICFFISSIYLIVRVIPNTGNLRSNSIISVLLGILLVTVMTGASLLIHFNFVPFNSRNQYSHIGLLNWYWTSYEVIDNGWNRVNPELFTMWGALAGIVILIAVVLASRELLIRPEPLPERVLTDIEEIRKSKLPQPGETIDDIFAESQTEN